MSLNWIEWNGELADRDLPPGLEFGTVVVVQCRSENRSEVFVECAEKAGFWRWQHLGTGDDIIAYAVIEPDGEPK